MYVCVCVCVCVRPGFEKSTGTDDTNKSGSIHHTCLLHWHYEEGGQVRWNQTQSSKHFV